MNTSSKLAAQHSNVEAVELDDNALETVAGGVAQCVDGDRKKGVDGIFYVCENGKWENAGINI